MPGKPANPNPEKTVLVHVRSRVVVEALFLLLSSLLYLWLRVEPVLAYSNSLTPFLLKLSFLRPFLVQPGGLANYAGAFLTQLCFSSMLGAAVFSVLLVLSYLVVRYLLIELAGTEDAAWLGWIPVFLQLSLANRYDSTAFSVSAGFLGSVSLVAGWHAIETATLRGLRRLGALVLYGAIIFYVGGLLGAFLFAALNVLRPGKDGHDRYQSLALQLGCLLVPICWLAVTRWEPAKLFAPWPRKLDFGITLALYFWLPVAGFAYQFATRHRLRVTNESEARSKKPHQSVRETTKKPVGLPRTFVPELVVLFGWLVVWFTFDEQKKALAKINYHAEHHQYEEVLRAARTLKEWDYPSEVRVQWALYHTGRMPEDLFSFSNRPGASPLLGAKGGLNSCRAQSQTALELGLINDAEHLAHEALEWEGNRPDLLRLLTQVNLLKNRPKAAAVFVNFLNQIPFQKRTDRPQTESPQLLDDFDLALLRGRIMTNDFPHDGFPTEPLLENLLATNPTNRMAFEYLMTQYLVSRDLSKVVEQLKFLDRFGYVGIPRHYEEAILLHSKLKGVQVELKGRRIRPETLERFKRFSEAMDRQYYATPEGQAALARDFGDTLWYFYFKALPDTKPETAKG